LILGVNGFIGHHLSRRLIDDTDWEVYGMDMHRDRLADLLDHPCFHFFEGDITINKEWVQYHICKCDVVLPLVAIATPAAYVKDPLRVFALDFEANLPIVRQCVEDVGWVERSETQQFLLYESLFAASEKPGASHPPLDRKISLLPSTRVLVGFRFDPLNLRVCMKKQRGFCGALYVRPNIGYIPQLQLLQRKIHPVPVNNRPISSRKRGKISLTPCQTLS
jgi:hypothetical protein